MKKLFIGCALLALATSCVSTKLTIRNIDDNAVIPAIGKDQAFILTEISTDSKYGYHENYPVNLGFMPVQSAEINVKRYFGALTGPKGEKISYNKVDSCCPFPSVKNDMGAGILDIYEVTWEGLSKPKRIYINLYERGAIIAPQGFGIRPKP